MKPSTLNPLNTPGMALTGRLQAAGAATLEITGLEGLLPIGSRISIDRPPHAPLLADVIAIAADHLLAMPLGEIEGIRHGQAVRAIARSELRPDFTWRGRIIGPLAEPIDGQGPLPRGPWPSPARRAAPEAARRAKLGPVIGTAVRALDLFAPCRQGQRLGLFAASGIGKSTLLGMLARGCRADIIVTALIGERGREVREFVEDELGPAGAARSICVVATADAPPALRREAAYTATAIAEHFRDRGLHVLLLLDSLTRFCASCRDIALAAGEVPAMRGFPPSVFAELPRLLERAGPGLAAPPGQPGGHITAFYSVLVDGDDHDEPVADAVRGLLDGHIVLSRSIAEAGRYPAIDILRSLSRGASAAITAEHAALSREARTILAQEAPLRDLLRLGAYSIGTDSQGDRALALAPRITGLLQQAPDEASRLEDSLASLRDILRAIA